MKDMEVKLKELEALLVSHDWYYAMSDDNYYYKQGRRSFEMIWKLMNMITLKKKFSEKVIT